MTDAENRGKKAGGVEMDYTVLEIRTAGVRADRLSLVGQMMGEVLDRHIRAEDVLLRFHNARFVVVLVDVKPEIALVICERLLLAVEGLRATGLVADPMDVQVQISSHVRPEESGEPSVQAAVAGAMVGR